MGFGAHVAELILALFVLLGSIYSLFSLVCVWRFFRRANYDRAAHKGPYPPVSILKPMKGIDPEWRNNIASFVAQNYPEYEILLGFNDPHDEGIALAKDIAESQAPKVRLIVHEGRLGSNPKVANLHGLIEHARYPLLLISDSDIKVDRGYLKEIVGEYLSDEKVGIVTCLSKITSASTVGAGLELLTTASDFIPSVLAANSLEGITFGLGPSMLLSRRELEQLGGLPAFADYLAEDYQIGNCLWKKEFRNILSNHLIENVLGRMRIGEYFVHQLRWARTYRACRPIGFFGYGITHIFPCSLLFTALHGVNALSVSVIAAVLALRYGILFVVSRMAAYPGGWFKWAWLLPAKDLFSFCIWLWCYLGSDIYWRGNHYRLLRGGLMKKLD
jgi:ceramide glucosyltransferase